MMQKNTSARIRVPEKIDCYLFPLEISAPVITHKSTDP